MNTIMQACELVTLTGCKMLECWLLAAITAPVALSLAFLVKGGDA
jgi:hypothetical protein